MTSSTSAATSPPQAPPPRTNLSFPLKLYKTTDIQSNPPLNTSLTTFINHVFASQKWDRDRTTLRFPTAESLVEMLGPDGWIVVLMEPTSASEQQQGNGDGEEGFREEIIACAAAVPWAGDVSGVKADENGTEEEGYEIKTVTSAKAPVSYRKQGLASRCVAKLEEHLLSTVKAEGGGKKKVDLWIQTEEELNGEYWRRRGFVDVRRNHMPAGSWGAYREFVVVVLRKFIERK
ncbi:hypothetical protein GQ43DRAFT_380583 [Delitschia confertaspora ATCC 74209]|uniref:Uncharacterized protein n=1 Tax=Delitschia confertaspora ATCC 74209 TaxID=1513339 RepID=A0A9P4MLX1_9PLEO|nr:hypothetical protein GQ43DRAFT_380583 [Delitschia confertaspora ATCC 74209]